MQEVVKNYIKHIHCFNYELIHLIAKTMVTLQVYTFMETFFFKLSNLKVFLR